MNIICNPSLNTCIEVMVVVIRWLSLTRMVVALPRLNSWCARAIYVRVLRLTGSSMITRWIVILEKLILCPLRILLGKVIGARGLLKLCLGVIGLISPLRIVV